MERAFPQDQESWEQYSQQLLKRMTLQEHCESQGEQSQTSNQQTITSSKCQHGECDGSGWINFRDENGNDAAKVCKCNDERIENNMLGFAKIPSEFKNLSVKSFNTNLYGPKGFAMAAKAKEIVAGYIKSFSEMQSIGKGLFLWSSTRGSGKTRIAVSTGNALIKRNKQRVRFITTLELLGQIKNTYNNNKDITEHQLINDFCEIPILILDDIGTEQSTPWVNEIFFKLLDYRMTHYKVTIITSNLNIDQLQHDERIKSRIRKMCIIVQMPEEDIRAKLGQVENEDIINKLLK